MPPPLCFPCRTRFNFGCRGAASPTPRARLPLLPWGVGTPPPTYKCNVGNYWSGSLYILDYLTRSFYLLANTQKRRIYVDISINTHLVIKHNKRYIKKYTIINNVYMQFIPAWPRKSVGQVVKLLYYRKLDQHFPHPLFLPKSRNSLPYSAKIILYSSPRGRYNKAIISEGGMYQ